RAAWVREIEVLAQRGADVGLTPKLALEARGAGGDDQPLSADGDPPRRYQPGADQALREWGVWMGFLVTHPGGEVRERARPGRQQVLWGPIGAGFFRGAPSQAQPLP